MKTFKSFPLVSLVIALVLSLTSCDTDGLVTVQQELSQEVSSRSCSTITEAWIHQLKVLVAINYSIAYSSLEVSAVEKVGDADYVTYSSEELVAKEVTDSEAFLLLITKGTFEGDVIGYYSSQLSFCVVPNPANVLVDNVVDLLSSTIGVIGGDADNF